MSQPLAFATQPAQAPSLAPPAPAAAADVEALVAARMELLLADGVDVVFNCRLDDSLSTVLESAASLGKHQLLGALLQRFYPASTATATATGAGCRPDIDTDLPAAALAAARNGHSRCLRLLLDTCASTPKPLSDLLEERETYGEEGGNLRTPLMLAVSGGHTDCVRLLLEYIPELQVLTTNLTPPEEGAFNALMFAASGGHPAIVQLLLEHSPQLQMEQTDWMYWMPGQYCMCDAVALAAARGHAACLRLLLEHSPGLDTELGSTALELAAGQLHADCLELLLDHGGAFPQQALDTALLALCTAWAGRDQGRDNANSAERGLRGVRCAHLLLARGAQLPRQVPDAAAAFLFPVVRDLAARALVPHAANEAVLGLALAASSTRQRKRAAAGGGGKGDAAQPAKCTCTGS